MADNKRKWGVLPILIIFLTVPFISSVISTFHITDFVGLGNGRFMAWALSVTFELGAIVSFISLSPSILSKLKKGWIIFIFMILFILQSIGNIYSSFEYMREKLIEDPTWLAGIMEMTFNFMTITQAKLTLSILIGLPIPLISLILLKSAIDYLNIDDSGKKINNKKSSDKDDLSEILAVKPKVLTKPKKSVKQKNRVKTKPVLESKTEPVTEPVVETVIEDDITDVIADSEPAVEIKKDMIKKESSPKTDKSEQVDLEFGLLKDTDEKKNLSRE